MMGLEDHVPIKAKEGEKQNNLWILTFADFMSIMLAFFVLLYSMVATETGEWRDVQKSLEARFSSSTRWEVQFTPPEEETLSPLTITRTRAADIEYLLNILAEKIAQAPELSSLTIHPQGDRIILSLPADNIFNPGEVRVRKEAGDILARLGQILASLNNKVEVNVHTDTTPPVGLPSNWEVSLTRAAVMARSLRQYGYLYHIETFGFGDIHADEVSPALPEATRNAQARRVDIVIRQQIAH